MSERISAISERIRIYEIENLIDPDCKMCIEYFYPRILAGAAISDIFAPPHKPSKRCESGSRPHCSCDICF